jgi:hypothetical protein
MQKFRKKKAEHFDLNYFQQNYSKLLPTFMHAHDFDAILPNMDIKNPGLVNGAIFHTGLLSIS